MMVPRYHTPEAPASFSLLSQAPPFPLSHLTGRPAPNAASVPKMLTTTVSGSYISSLSFSLAICFLYQHTQPLHANKQVNQENFSKVQFLAFSLFTSPGGSFSCENTSAPCYVGDQVTAHDLTRRVSVLSQAMSTAAAHVDKDPNTLKVFAAPEFFFRGAFGAYDANSWAKAQFGLSSMLEQLTSLPPFNNWLVICGTIIAVHYGNASRSAFYNAAPIYFRGRKLIAFKKYISHIDFLDVVGSRRIKNPFIVCNATANQPCLYSPSQQWMLHHFGFSDYEMVANNTFDILGARVGLEICLDHAYGELSKHLPYNDVVDLHIIVSGGMSIETGPVMVSKSGVCLLADGFAKSQINRNWFGRGHQERDPIAWDDGSNGTRQPYDVGPVFERSFLSAFESHLWDESTEDIHESSCQSQSSPLQQVVKLENWEALLLGLFPTHMYRHANDLHKLVEPNANSRFFCGPTIDTYQPIFLS